MTAEVWSGTRDRLSMLLILRFLWNATRGSRLTPWRSAYLRWRIETYCGVRMEEADLVEFWGFAWRERANLWRFLKWVGEMESFARAQPKNPW